MQNQIELPLIPSPGSATAGDPANGGDENCSKGTEPIGGEKAGEDKGMQLSLGEYLLYIKGEIESEKSCLELPFTLLLLFSFAFMALWHLKQHRVYSVEHALSFDVTENANFAWEGNMGHKTINDVNSFADFWSWTRLGFLPLVLQQSWSYSEDMQLAYNEANKTHPMQVADLPSFHGGLPKRNDFLHYNRIVGGLRFQQERSPSEYDLCRIPQGVSEDLWKKWLGRPCMPATPAYERVPECTDAEAFTVPERREWFLSALDPVVELQRKVVDMEDGCSRLKEKGDRTCSCSTCDGMPWLDEQTQRVEIGLVIYNPQYGLISLLTINFYFNRAGHIFKFVHVQSAWADLFAGSVFEIVPLVMCDLIYLLAIVKVFWNELSEIMRVIMSSKNKWYKSLAEDYISFWTMVNWISIGCAILVVVLAARLMGKTNLANEAIRGVISLEGDDTALVDRELYGTMLQSLFSAVDEMCTEERWYRNGFSIYPMVVMMRLFKSFDAQPRLAVVTRTLMRSSQSLLHFFIVFFSIYGCMVVNAVLIFGQDMEDFSTVSRGISTCFRFTFEEFLWAGMIQVGREKAMFWLWLFNIIMTVVLINMLLAILMDSYQEVKEELVNSQTLFTQISEMVRRTRQSRRKERVRLSDVWDTYFQLIRDEKEMLGSNTRVTASDILDMVGKKGMKREQAERTLKNAMRLAEQKQSVEYTIEDVTEGLHKLDCMSRLTLDEVTSTWDLLKKYDPQHGRRTFVPNYLSAEEQREDVVSTLKDVVGALGGQVVGALQEETQIFSEKQASIDMLHQDIHVCAKDTHRVLQQMRAQSEGVMRALKASNAPTGSQERILAR